MLNLWVRLRRVCGRRSRRGWAAVAGTAGAGAAAAGAATGAAAGGRGAAAAGQAAPPALLPPGAPPPPRLVVAELPQGHRHRPVDDLEHPAAGELLVLDQRDVRLDPGRVAIHHEGDRPGRRQDGDLAVAVAVAPTQVEALVPDGAGLGEQVVR